jgi:hypothetical protein
MTYEDVVRLALALPDVEESTSYGTPSLKARGRFLARIKEDGVTLALRCPFELREILLRDEPDVFHLTDHYRDYPAVLVRLPRIKVPRLKLVLKQAWEAVAQSPKASPTARRSRSGASSSPGRRVRRRGR